MATYLTFWALLLTGLGPLSAYYEVTSPLFGLYTVVAGLGLLALAFGFGLVQWLRYGRGAAPWLAILAGAMATGALGYLGYRALASPVSDLSTDADKPPLFMAPLYTVKAPGPTGDLDPAFLWPRDYTPAEAARQRARFGNTLQPFTVLAPPARAYPAVKQALSGLPAPWALSLASDAKFHLELVRENPLFHFVDDIVVELRPAPSSASGTENSVVVIRSRARWAPRGGALLQDSTTDFGTGARRIRYLAGLIQTALAPVEAAEKQLRAAPKTIPAASPNPAAAPPSAARKATKPGAKP